MKKTFKIFVLMVLTIILTALSVSAKEYVWSFEDAENSGAKAWSGNHSISINNGCMTIIREDGGESGGIDMKPSETLAASEYPYLVAKVIKPQDGTALTFVTYYVTGEMTGITGDGFKSVTYPEYSDETYDYYIFDYSEVENYGKGNIDRFVFTVSNPGTWSVDELILTDDLSFLDIESNYTGDYYFEFNGANEAGVSAWSGNHSITFSDGCMIIDRNTNGTSGGINVTPQKKLRAENYPYLVIKAKKNNASNATFLTYYVTGEMTGITGDGFAESYPVEYDDDTYAYYVTDFSEKSGYANGYINNFVLTVANLGTHHIDRLILTDDLSFIGIKEAPTDENIKEFRLDGDETITSDKGSVTLTPYLVYSDGTVETDYSKVKYSTDTVNAELSVSGDGKVTVTGFINGSVTITAILPDSVITCEKTVKITGQPDRIATNDYNVVMYGNSIRAHPPAPSIGWPEYADWGMAASSTEKDYAHRFVYYMEQKYGKGSVTLHPTTTSATLEWAIAGKGDNYDYSADTEVMKFINTVIAEATAAEADIVTFQMGENVGLNATATEYYHATTLLVSKVKEALPDALVVLCTPFWGGANKVKGSELTVKECDIPLAPLHTLASDKSNYAYDAEWLANADGGVKNHPGDKGMDNIAKLIYAKVNPVLSENSSTVYTTVPAAIEISPENPTITTEKGKITLSARIYPEDASQDVVWSCDNKDIAAIDKNGVVTAINNGTAVITAKSKYVDSVTATINVVISGQTLPFTVTYDKNTTDNVTNMPSPNTLAKENFVFDPIYPTRKNYRFMGWSLTPDGEVITGADITENTTVYAIWEKAYRWDFSRDGYKEDFTVNYGFNQYVTDGKFMAIATDTNFETGEVLTVVSPEIEINPKEYYALVIRMENSGFKDDTVIDFTFHTTTGDVKAAKNVETTESVSYEFILDDITGTITGFEFKPANIDCTIKLDNIEFCKAPLLRFDCGTDNIGEISNMPSNIYEAPNNTIILPDTTPSREGFTFLGWVTEKGSKLLVDETEIKLNENTVFYAVWDKNDHFEMDSADDYNISSIVSNETWFSDGIYHMTTYKENGVADPIISPKKSMGYTAESTSGIVEYRMKWNLPASTEHTKIYFTTDAGPNLSEANGNHIMLDKAASDGFEIKTIDLSNITTWKGNIKSFRFDPYNGNGTAEIDYIRFTDSEANIVTQSGSVRKLTADDKAYHIIRKDGILAPVGKVEIENLALSGNIDMTSGYITVSNKIEISDDADYTVFTLDFDLHGISSEDEMYISGCEIPVTPVDGAKYIVKTYNGSGFVAFRNKDSNELTFKAVGTESSEFTVFATSFKGIRLNSASVIKKSDMRNGNICITLDGDFSRLVTLNNTKSLRPVFGAITIK